jgi:methionyl-tRNA synthetase
MYKLEGKKFSTSRKHAIWVNDFLQTNSLDLTKFYLAKTYSKTYENNFSRLEFAKHSSNLIISLKEIINNTNKVICNYWEENDSLEAGQWLFEDRQYYNNLQNHLDQCMAAYAIFSPEKATSIIERIILEIVLYCTDTTNMLNLLPMNYMRTRIVLQIYGIKILGLAAFPILHELSKMIFYILGLKIDLALEKNVVNKFNQPVHILSLLTFLKENYYYEN